PLFWCNTSKEDQSVGNWTFVGNCERKKKTKIRFDNPERSRSVKRHREITVAKPPRSYGSIEKNNRKRPPFVFITEKHISSRGVTPPTV
ncbi:1118_t:CDS:2, partial [Dentiscutata erythropus]